MSTSSFFTGGESPQTNVYEDEAKVYAEAAEASAQDAADSASAAATSAGEAAGKALDADNAADAAVAAKNVAETKAGEAASSASGASASATAAATSAANAANSANTANTNATNAATSASTAASSATSAADSASAAGTSASNAASSATSASSSATTATTKANEAASSATAAASSASGASTSATNAASSASAASTSASNASTSASNASTSATNAANSATSASNSATAASTSATAAAGSATAAASAQTAAESARDATLAAYDSFDDRYLGTKASNPTVDNDGNALVAGALYFNSTAGEMRVYTGSIWTAAYVSGTGVLLQTNNLSDLANAATARTNLGLATVAATGAISDTTGTLTVARGGTGATSLTSGYLLKGNGTSAVSASVIYDDGTNVGIGTSSPGAKLDVAGTGYFSDNVTLSRTNTAGSLSGMTITNAGTTAAYAGININSGTVTSQLFNDAAGNAVVAGTVLRTTSNHPLVFGTNATERMRLDTSGNLGIGVTNPSAKIDLAAGSGTAQVGLRIRSAAANSNGFNILTNSTTDEVSLTNFYNASVILGTNNTERMRITAAGNVGIGTSAPGSKLDVVGGSSTGGFTVGGSVAAVRASSTVIDLGDSNRFMALGPNTTTAGAMKFIVASSDASVYTTAATIDSSGNVGIGTSFPLGRAHVSGGNFIINASGTYSEPAMNAGIIAYDSVNGSLAISARSNGGDTYTRFFTSSGGTGTERFRISSTGAWGLSGANYGSAGQVLTSNGSGSAPTWQSASSTVSYPQNVQSGNYTLVLSDAGKHIYSANTGAQTITIPTNASVAFPIGTLITIVNMGTNKITLSFSGVSLYSNGSTSALSTAIVTSGTSIQLMKTATNSWNATFGNLIPNTYSGSYLMVAGGGGGGGQEGGGGGAGGMLTGTQTFVGGTTYSFTVGGGGAGAVGQGTAGSNTTAFSLTAVGGGGGGGGGGAAAGNGGSGGGAGGYSNPTAKGLGTAGQGNNGGNGDSSPNYGGGGGGGAGGVGQAAGGSVGGNGGVGLQSSITGTATYYAGGGGGGIYSSGSGGTGGSGGGANGGNGGAGTYAPSGTANTGGGGGGGGNVGGFQTGGTGGSGVIIISVPTADYSGNTTGSPTVTTSGSNTILTFTSSGSYTA